MKAIPKPLLTLPLLAFVTGFAATRSLLPQAAAAAGSSPHSNPAVFKRERQATQATPVGRYKDFYRPPSGERGMHFNPDLMRAAGLSMTELGDLVMSLMRCYQAENGYFDEFGVSSSFEGRALTKTFHAMYDKDPAAALEWVMGLEHKPDRMFFFQRAIDLEAGRDLDAALALMGKVVELTGESFDITQELMRAGINQGADGLLRVIAASMRENGSIDDPHDQSWYVKYPDDFDFKAALDGIAAIEKNAPQGQGLTAVPNDLLGNWAAKDPEAAAEWFFAGNRLPVNGVSQFFEQYSYNSKKTGQEVGALVARLFDSVADGPTKYAETWDALSIFDDRDVLEAFLAAESVQGGATEHVIELLRTSMNDKSFLGARKAAEENLLATLDAQQRREFFQQQATKIAEEDLQPWYGAILGTLGHSAAEISEMLPPSKTK